jgi:hypothetical protein
MNSLYITNEFSGINTKLNGAEIKKSHDADYTFKIKMGLVYIIDI